MSWRKTIHIYHMSVVSVYDKNARLWSYIKSFFDKSCYNKCNKIRLNY